MRDIHWLPEVYFPEKGCPACQRYGDMLISENFGAFGRIAQCRLCLNIFVVAINEIPMAEKQDRVDSKPSFWGVQH